jgi:ligand-binding sensor domain-containing protein
MKKYIFIIISCFTIELCAQTITNYTTADGLISDFVECVAVDNNDNIWFGTSSGVQMFDGTNWTSYNTSIYPSMASDNIKVISTISNGDIWIGTDFGASRYDGIEWTTYTSATMQSIPLISNQIKSIDEDPSTGIIWIGTNQGVTPLDLSGATNSLSIGTPDLHWSGVNATSFDANGDIWFSSPLGGITHYDGVSYTTYDTSNGLLSQYATDLIIDNQDNKWVGTSSGMSILDASNTYFTNHTRMYIMPPPDTLNPVVNIALDGWGRMWTSIYVGYLSEGGIAYWNGSIWNDFHVSDGLAGPNVKGLAIDSQNNVWLATTTGVSKISAIPSAINETKISELKIFPNPTKDILYLFNKGETIEKVKMYNNLGALIYSDNVMECQYYIDVSFISQGLYYLDIQFSDRSISKKIIIN